jgi:hypothetical protein
LGLNVRANTTGRSAFYFASILQVLWNHLYNILIYKKL